VDIYGIVERQVIDVFEMLVRNDNDIPVVVGPLMRTDKGCDGLIVVDDVAFEPKGRVRFRCLE